MAASSNAGLGLVCLAAFAFSIATSALECTSSFVYRGQSKSFGACNTLEGPAELAWTYFPSNSTLEVAFMGQAPTPTGWVGWGINLGPRPVMVGTNALVGFRNMDRSDINRYKLTSEVQASGYAAPGRIDIDVLEEAVEITGTTVTLFATIQLGPNQTKINHVWNRGTKTIGNRLLQHEFTAEYLKGVGTIDLASRSVISTEAPHQKLKNSHGALNAVGWGFFLPLGVMIARYARPFSKSCWFYVHASFQSLGLILGIIGWIIGLRLGSYSAGVVHHHHRNIGTAIFVCACLQAFGAVFRPGTEHKLRRYWNIYHHTIGYLMLILIFTNIYRGFHILHPKKRWTNAYSGFLALFVIVSCILEAAAWIIYFKRRRNAAKEAQLPSYNPRQQESNIQL